MELQFEWDKQKAKLNLKKHSIDFEEAKTVFRDPLAYIFDDEWHSVGEKRQIIIVHDRKLENIAMRSLFDLTLYFKKIIF